MYEEGEEGGGEVYEEGEGRGGVVYEEGKTGKSKWRKMCLQFHQGIPERLVVQGVHQNPTTHTKE